MLTEYIRSVCVLGDEFDADWGYGVARERMRLSRQQRWRMPAGRSRRGCSVSMATLGNALSLAIRNFELYNSYVNFAGKYNEYILQALKLH